MMYDFSPELFYIVNIPLAVVSLLVSLLCSMGATFISCYAEFREVPAQLIRPKSPKNGKRSSWSGSVLSGSGSASCIKFRSAIFSVTKNGFS